MNKVKTDTLKRYLLIVSTCLCGIHILIPIIRLVTPISIGFFKELDSILLFCVFILGIICFFNMKGKYTELRKGIIGRSLFYDFLGLMLLFVLLVVSSLRGATSIFESLSENNNYIKDYLITAFVMIPLAIFYVRNGVPKVIIGIIKMLVCLGAVGLVYVLFVVCSGGTLYINGGLVGVASYSMPRLEINCNPNTTGTYSVTLLFLSMFFATCGKNKTKYIFSATSLVYIVVLFLSNSRGAILAGAIGIGVYSAILVKDKIRFGKDGIQKLVVIASGILGIVLTLVLWTGVVNVFSYVLSGGEFVPGGAVHELDFHMAGRPEVWKVAITSLFSNIKYIISGTSPAGVVPLMNDMSNGVMNYYTHNQIIEVGLSLGIPAMIVFLWWLLLLAKKCLYIGWNEKKVQTSDKLIPIIILVLVINNMVEATLLFYNFFTGGVFFVLVGWCYGKITQYKEE